MYHDNVLTAAQYARFAVIYRQRYDTNRQQHRTKGVSLRIGQGTTLDRKTGTPGEAARAVSTIHKWISRRQLTLKPTIAPSVAEMALSWRRIVLGCRRLRDSWLLLSLPALLLVVVALVQIQLTRSTALTPWKGGGFGMFSTIDNAAHRRLRVWLIGDSVLALTQPEGLGRSVWRALTLPSDGSLAAVADRAADRYGPDVDELHAIRVEVWSRTYDRETLQPSFRGLRALEVQLDAPLD